MKELSYYSRPDVTARTGCDLERDAQAHVSPVPPTDTSEKEYILPRSEVQLAEMSSHRGPDMVDKFVRVVITQLPIMLVANIVFGTDMVARKEVRPRDKQHRVFRYPSRMQLKQMGDSRSN